MSYRDRQRLEDIQAAVDEDLPALGQAVAEPIRTLPGDPPPNHDTA